MAVELVKCGCGSTALAWGLGSAFSPGGADAAGYGSHSRWSPLRWSSQTRLPYPTLPVSPSCSSISCSPLQEESSQDGHPWHRSPMVLLFSGLWALGRGRTCHPDEHPSSSLCKTSAGSPGSQALSPASVNCSSTSTLDANQRSSASVKSAEFPYPPDHLAFQALSQSDYVMLHCYPTSLNLKILISKNWTKLHTRVHRNILLQYLIGHLSVHGQVNG